MSALISALAWVPQGRSQRHPAKYQLDEKELARVSALARVELEDAKEAFEKAGGEDGKGIVMAEDEEDGKIDDEGWESDEDSNASKSGGEDEDAMAVDEAPKPAAAGPADPNDLSAYNLDTYDEEESKGAATGVFSNIKGLTYYRNAEDDPFITLKENDDDLEREDLEVLPTDNLLITAKTEDDLSQLEIHVYDETEENLYVHHDLMLPAFPLCLEWLDFPPNNGSSENDNSGSATAGPSKTHGSYIAVGTFDPEIEIWSLDTVDGLYPDALLGRPDVSSQHVPVPLGTGKKKKKLVKARTANPHHHVDAVLSLSWNTQHRSLLASASADETVKLWDLSRPSTEPAVRSFDLHRDKVQAVEWNKSDPTVLLTGSYDRTVRTWDTRSPGTGVGALVGSDVEAVRWDPFDSHAFYVSLESGLILNYDMRKLSSSSALLSSSTNSSTTTPAKFTLAAHEGAASSLDVSPHVRGCLATGGTDKMVKLWNINENEDTTGKREVSLVTSRDLGVGRVFSLSFSPDTPLTLAAAGSKAKLQVWDLASNAGARKAFGARLRKAGRELREAKEAGQGLIGVQSDGEDSEDDMEE